MLRIDLTRKAKCKGKKNKETENKKHTSISIASARDLTSEILPAGISSNLKLQHSAKGPVRGDALSWAYFAITRADLGFPMSESETDEQALAHWVFAISHILQG
jgi:hypothetical protein